MVEIVQAMRKIYITLTFLLISAAVAAQELPTPVEARIAGLEQNEEYMSLLREDALLQQREDSIATAVVGVRNQLRQDPQNRAKYAELIMQAENEIFEVRNTKGRIIDRINTIEQDWVLSNLNSTITHPTQKPNRVVPDSLQRRNLVQNSTFRQLLTSTDYVALMRAQRGEMEAVDLVNRYLGNYLALGELDSLYTAAATEQEALDIEARFRRVEAESDSLSRALGEKWNYIYDNKSYAYDYMMEALRKEEQLDRQTERYSAAAREVASLSGQTASDELVDYFLRKRALVEYERAVASTLDLKAAADSLAGVEQQLSTIQFALPRVEIKERLFLQYDSIQFSSRPHYTAQNPIPETTIYQRGTIYRLTVGTFSTKRPVSTFRGAFPVSYVRTEDNRWRYFIGGFATMAEAEEGRLLLKKRGFLKPQIVVWIDGQYRNLSEEPMPTVPGGYRIEISGAQSLPDAVREVMKTEAPEVQLSRAGERFIVGQFADKAVADQVAASIRSAEPALDVRIVEVEQTVSNE